VIPDTSARKLGSSACCTPGISNNEQKLLTVSLDEFLRRFPLHLLLKGFVRMRNFGFLANRRHATFLPLCFQFARCGRRTTSRTRPFIRQ
jgi:Putative transposase